MLNNKLVRILVGFPLAADRGIAGACDVTFDLRRRGEPFQGVARCSDEIFVNGAVSAVSKTRFAPKVVAGVSKVFENAVSPLRFRLQN